jgi:hypothetical protein
MDKKLIFLPLLLAVACSRPAVQEQSPSEAVRSGGAVGERSAGGAAPEVRLARLPDSREGNAAAVAGTLRAEGACLYLEAASSVRFLIASTIPGARWDAAREALVIPSAAAGENAATYRSGERVTLGGSEAGAAVLSGKWVEPPAATCDTSHIWIANSITSAASG